MSREALFNPNVIQCVFLDVTNDAKVLNRILTWPGQSWSSPYRYKSMHAWTLCPLVKSLCKLMDASYDATSVDFCRDATHDAFSVTRASAPDVPPRSRAGCERPEPHNEQPMK